MAQTSVVAKITGTQMALTINWGDSAQVQNLAVQINEWRVKYPSILNSSMKRSSRSFQQLIDCTELVFDAAGSNVWQYVPETHQHCKATFGQLRAFLDQSTSVRFCGEHYASRSQRGTTIFETVKLIFSFDPPVSRRQ